MRSTMKKIHTDTLTTGADMHGIKAHFMCAELRSAYRRLIATARSRAHDYSHVNVATETSRHVFGHGLHACIHTGHNKSRKHS
jgi:hypothetical protein